MAVPAVIQPAENRRLVSPSARGPEEARPRPPRTIRVLLRPDWRVGDPRGLLSSDPRVRTLRKVLVTYPDVRHVLPDRLSVDGAADPRMVESLARFLERQRWLITSIELE